MPHPEDCTKVTTCTRYETCYVEQFVTSGGLILYNSGCLSKEVFHIQLEYFYSITVDL